MIPMQTQNGATPDLFNPGQYSDAIARAQAAQPAPAFVYGAGGRRMTPDQIARDHEIAAALMQPDYSPVRSPWQGLARASGNWLGALYELDARKADQANADANAQIVHALMDGDTTGSTADATQRAIAALTSPYSSKQVQALAKMQYERLNPKPAAPHYWQTNDGSLAMVGRDGQPTVLYSDPNPRFQWRWVTDPVTQRQTLIPFVGGQPVLDGMAGPAASAPPAGGSDSDWEDER